MSLPLRTKIDEDHDGFSPPFDCDDHDADTYPGAFEFCDYIDNNCDGQTDENWHSYFGGAFGKKCFVTSPEGCVSEGLWLCGPLRKGVMCSAWPRSPKALDVCNGVDDDCDGITDNNWPYLNTPCTVKFGVCTRAGIWACDNYTEDAYCTGEDDFPPDQSCSPPEDDSPP